MNVAYQKIGLAYHHIIGGGVMLPVHSVDFKAHNNIHIGAHSEAANQLQFTFPPFPVYTNFFHEIDSKPKKIPSSIFGNRQL